MISRRSRVDAEKNRLATALGARRSGGLPVLDLTISNPTTAEIPYDGDSILDALSSERALKYEPEPFGLPEARRAVSELWKGRGFDVPAERIALTASTSEAYSFLFKLLLDPGESILVPEPSYPLFEHLARYEGLRTVPYPLAYDGAWHVDLPALRARVDASVRAVVAVSPNNPTGSFLKRDELREMADLGLPIISDEVFGEYTFAEDPSRAGSALGAADGALVFALDGLSKLVGLPQMKLAWIAIGGPEAQVAAASSGLELVLDTFLSPGAPVQHALPKLLAAGRATRHAITERLRRNHEALGRAVRGAAATLLHVEGGWYAVLRLPATASEEEWALALLDDGVLVQPGYFYDFSDEPYLVVSLLTEEQRFADGVARILARVTRGT